MDYLLTILFGILYVGLFLRRKDLMAASYYSGYRRAIKDSLKVMEESAQEGFDQYPPGQIMEPLQRATHIGEAKDKVRELAQRIGRAV